MPKKSDIIPPEGQRNATSKRMECKWRVNIRFCRKLGYIRITKTDLTHNHPVDEPSSYYSEFRRAPDEAQRVAMQYMAARGFKATVIREVRMP